MASGNHPTYLHFNSRYMDFRYAISGWKAVRFRSIRGHVMLEIWNWHQGPWQMIPLSQVHVMADCASGRRAMRCLGQWRPVSLLSQNFLEAFAEYLRTRAMPMSALEC